MLSDLFTDKALVVLYILESKKQIQLIFLLDTDATGIAFIDKAMTCTVCEALKISFIKLAKLKQFKKFDSQSALLITHTIYLTLIVQNHTKKLVLLLVTKLGQYSIIFSKL